MTFMNTDANIKQFQLIKFVNENCNDDHVVSKITIVLRRDKIEAPYYMITKISMSSCIDRPENGLIHAMDILNQTRRHNLTEDTYNEIKSLITDRTYESQQVKISKTDEQLKMVLISKNDDEIRNLFENYGELFDKIDNLLD
ncbi:MAG: hypothetical protein IJL02_04715 [Methanobrevibacter sp.]|uniref:hypothetical protein n=1 Tax=Methanobrevibacter sp. TaxID=66852 RepID=UPI0025D75550|nr:hypothetical protein [Methanobrevibacter sp.]MBQ6099147.1 hypothetical protein [Methanobrevibacter sp.]